MCTANESVQFFENRPEIGPPSLHFSALSHLTMLCLNSGTPTGGNKREMSLHCRKRKGLPSLRARKAGETENLSSVTVADVWCG